MPDYCHIDFETFSHVTKLDKVGSYRYFDDPSTDVLCGAYAFDNGPIKLWWPGDDYPFGDFDGTFLAWNAGFERWCTNHVMTELYDWEHIPLRRWQCVAAQARCQALPGSLDKAAQFCKLPYKKDMQGHRIMLNLCKPASDAQQIKFWARKNEGALLPHEIKLVDRFGAEAASMRCHHTPEKMERLGRYCRSDVAPERALFHMLDAWDPFELECYYQNEIINDRGVGVDTDFARAAVEYADDENHYFRDQLKDITDGVVTTPKQYQRHKTWLMPHISEDVKDMMAKYEKGEKKYTLDSETRERILSQADHITGFISDDVYDFIDIIHQAGKSTISKYQSLCDRAITGLTDFDASGCRVHGSYVYAGAAQTLRFSSKGLQLHNMKRSVHPDAVKLIRAVIEHDDDYIRSKGDIINVLSELIRPVLIAALNRHLVWGDWSAIEARILPWLAKGMKGAQDLLDMFARGEDVYVKVASEILHMKKSDVDDDQRQSHGKIPQLSLGFGGGPGALLAMARGYRVHMTEDTAKSVVVTWRKTNPWAPLLWAEVERASMLAMRNAGRTFTAGRISYVYDPDSLGGLGALWALLPGGLELCYPGARVELVKKPWGDEELGITALKGAWHPKQGESQWPRVPLWYGLLVENAAQAVAGRIIKEAINEAPKEELDIVLHTHDELVIETGDPKTDKIKLKKLMERKLSWCMDLPMAAEVAHGKRYKVKL